MVNKSISIIGPGSLGSALAIALSQAGYSIQEVIHRGTISSSRKAKTLAKRVNANSVSLTEAGLDADIFWLCVPDHSIAKVARKLAEKKKSWQGTTVFHSSGALPSDELSPLRKQGATVASLHPLMTFVPGVDQSFAGVPFAVEGGATAVCQGRAIVHELKGDVFGIRKSSKAAYHAWAAFTSPLLLSLLMTAEQVAKLAGIPARQARRRMLPIVLQTIENYVNHGPAKALSGPILRGDLATIDRHLKALKPASQAHSVYLALTRAALETLPAPNRQAQRTLLLKPTQPRTKRNKKLEIRNLE